MSRLTVPTVRPSAPCRWVSRPRFPLTSGTSPRPRQSFICGSRTRRRRTADTRSSFPWSVRPSRHRMAAFALRSRTRPRGLTSCGTRSTSRRPTGTSGVTALARAARWVKAPLPMACHLRSRSPCTTASARCFPPGTRMRSSTRSSQTASRATRTGALRPSSQWRHRQLGHVRRLA